MGAFVNWLWLIPFGGFAVFETLALLNRKDRFEPATYWIRKLLMLRNRWGPVYWLGLGLWLWLGLHFFVDAG